MEGLLGRGEERSRLDQILARARHGHSGALVIRGEPGVGKTVLLDYTQATAARMQVIRVDAVETEMQLSFAALQPGDSVKVAGDTYVYRQLIDRPNVGNHSELRACFDVYHGSTSLGRQCPGKNFYFREQQASSEMSIATTSAVCSMRPVNISGIGRFA